MIYYTFIVVSIALLLGCTAQVEPVDLEAEKSAVKEIVDQMAQAMEAEDMETFSNRIAHDPDMVNFGTDAAERWVGWDALKASVEQQFAAFENGKVSTRDQVIKVHSSGQVAWLSEIMDWSVESQGQRVDLNGLRLTGVLEKRNGKWLFVQMHFSAPVSDQAVEY